MERIVHLVTKNLIRRLPTEKEFFRLDQLRKLDFPAFIVDRIGVEMDQNLDDSIVPPYTEWADMKNRNVQEAWDDFVEAIRSEARLPGAYAPSVVESAVSDCMEMLIQPRKKIPEIIFGTDKALDRETLEERSKRVVVYRHLALAPVKYLYRKDMQAITYEQCNRIIDTVDEKLVSRYNALNWAHLLEPLFELMGDTIDTNLLRIFFQDKRRPRFARKFDEMSSSVSRSGLIEVLSSAELIEDPEKDELMESLFGEESSGTPKKEEEPTGIGLDISRISRKQDPQDEDDEVPLHSRFMFDESAIYQPETDEEEEPEEEPRSFNAMFNDLDHVREKESEEAGQTGESEEKVETIEPAASENKTTPDPSGTNDIKAVDTAAGDAIESEDANEEEEIELVKQFEQGNDVEDDSILSETEPPEEDEEETYIWKNFMQEEVEDEDVEDDEVAVDEFEDNENEAIEEVSEEESGPAITRAEDLKNWIGDNADRFVKELFQGSETAFEEAIEEIAEFNDWKAATRYIEKEIFSRNLIDMYDEVAVDFTDQLHSFFMEIKST